MKTITNKELKEILQKHEKWQNNESDGERANLWGADLWGANLWGADLWGANLWGANLREADLRGANLWEADLRGANLGNTCLDNNLQSLLKKFCKECPPLLTGGRIVFRTATSQHIGNQEYEPGHTYTAPNLSFDVVTACHPGIYAASLQWMKENYPGEKLVVCYVRDGDWIISSKGAIRCKKLRVLKYYKE